jgi:predicted Zn-dependent protease
MALQEVRDVEGSPARAQALISLDRLTEAGRVARRATEMHPDSPMAWLALARWELASGNYRETLDAVGRAERAGKTTETEDLRNVASERLGKP